MTQAEVEQGILNYLIDRGDLKSVEGSGIEFIFLVQGGKELPKTDGLVMMVTQEIKR